MENREQASHAQNNIDRIRELNDRLRVNGVGGRIVITCGVNALPPNVFAEAMAAIRSFDAFAAENDIRILRRVEGKEYVRNFRYADVRKGEHLEQNILLQSGDTVVVP